MLNEPATLAWIPKPFGPGDLDGDGWLKLLGKPDVDLPSMLVRETAQNSWDARLDDEPPLFEMHLRTLPPEAAWTLRHRVFSDGHSDVGLSGHGDQRPLRVLEISDRRTRGLRGPVRNDRAIPRGTPTDFIDFVLGVGAPPEDPRGGGSYGFGKVVSYMASGRGTILVWSHVETEDHGLEHRLVGSAIGKSFEAGDVRYTGRHWWGVETPVEDGGPVQPLLGAAAEKLAGSIFSRGFGRAETGTSLLILDPVLADASNDRELVESWREAIVQNLWPKLMSGEPRGRRMDISLVHEGRSIDLRPTDDPRMAAFGACLTAVRATQEGTGEISPTVTVKEVRSLKPLKLVGHLALTSYPIPAGTPEELTHHVCLMRNEAELVVKYVKHPHLPDASVGWAAVFKPTRDLDPLFTRSEPPAHDDWVPRSMPTRSEKILVGTCFNKGDEIVKEFLTPKAVPADAEGQVSGGDLSFALAGLAGTAIGSKPVLSPKPPASGGGKAHKKGSVRILILGSQLVADPSRARGQTVRIELSVEGSERVELLPSRLAWAVEGGRERDREGLLGQPPELVRWIINAGTARETVSLEATVVVRGGDRVTAEVSGSRDRALDVDFKTRSLTE